MVLLSIVGCCLPALGFAHTLQRDEPIGALLHVSPDDDPIVGQPSTLLFEFQDSTQKFTVATCECVATILRAGEKIYELPLSAESVPGSAVHAAFAFVFPAEDTYRLEVSGTPTVEGRFEPFVLTYDLQVARTASQWPRLHVHSLHLIGAGIVPVFVVGMVLFKRFQKVTKKPTKD